jgi:hypothetical protein
MSVAKVRENFAILVFICPLLLRAILIPVTLVVCILHPFNIFWIRHDCENWSLIESVKNDLLRYQVLIFVRFIDALVSLISEAICVGLVRGE